MTLRAAQAVGSSEKLCTICVANAFMRIVHFKPAKAVNLAGGQCCWKGAKHSCGVKGPEQLAWRGKMVITIMSTYSFVTCTVGLLHVQGNKQTNNEFDGF